MKEIECSCENRLLLKANDTSIGSFLGLRAKKANYIFAANLPENDMNPTMDRPAIFDIHVRGNTEGMFTNVSLIFQ